jgi:hypothetical protein
MTTSFLVDCSSRRRNPPEVCRPIGATPFGKKGLHASGEHLEGSVFKIFNRERPRGGVQFALWVGGASAARGAEVLGIFRLGL